MPYRHAHWYVSGLILLTPIAFWPGYFSVLATAPWGFHLHGITATIWLLLLAGQSWSAHGRRMELHRAFGRASLFFFPVFLAGTIAVLLSMARATPVDPFYGMYGARLGIIDAIAAVMVAWLYHRAVAERRQVQRHARYMLATPLFLLSPILGRLAGGFLPQLRMHGPQDFHLFNWSVQLANVVTIAIAVALWRHAPRHGRPFLTCAIVLVAQSIAFETIGHLPAWRALFGALAALPPVPTLLATAAAGAVLVRSAWVAGGRPPVRRAMAG